MRHVPTTVLGDSLEVSALGYGAMGLAALYGPADEPESLATLHHALDAGVTFLDTADVYGNGSNERLLSSVLAERRDEVVLATKFGIVPGDGGPLTMSTRNDAAYAAQACDATPASPGWASRPSTSTTCTAAR